MEGGGEYVDSSAGSAAAAAPQLCAHTAEGDETAGQATAAVWEGAAEDAPQESRTRKYRADGILPSNP